MNTTIKFAAVLLSLVASSGIAAAQGQPGEETPLNPFAPRTPVAVPQPADTVPSDTAPAAPDSAEVPSAPPAALAAPDEDTLPADQPPVDEAPTASTPATNDQQPAAYSKPEAPAKPKIKQKPLAKHPVVLATPTAHLLPAAMIYSSTSIDTGGGFGTSLKVGLGDVGEFGVATTDRIRFVSTAGDPAETVQPLVMASFKMGVAEDRLFDQQPALALGFQKSFQNRFNNYDLRVAAIELMASKTIGPVSVHAGGIFWDASMDDTIRDTSVVLHDHGTKRQIRPIAGLEAEPLKNAQLLIDLYWVPLFDPTQSNASEQIALRPSLSWGVRYKVGSSVSIESGVRVPDIGEANLLDAQIFGQLTFSSSKLRSALGVGE